MIPSPFAPKLAASTVHVWTFHVDRPDIAWNEVEVLLSADELARAARFHFDRDRRRFSLTRACLRRVLGAYSGVDAGQLTFCYSPYGKPRLQNASIDIRFNVSHSDALATLAITCGREIGIDIEKIRDDVEIEQLARRFFSAVEFEAFSREGPQLKTAAFFRTWTCKEAFVKGQGMGLSLPLDCFDVEVNTSKPAALLATRPDTTQAGQWSFRLLDLAPGYAAAMAVNGGIQELSILPADDGSPSE